MIIKKNDSKPKSQLNKMIQNSLHQKFHIKSQKSNLLLLNPSPHLTLFQNSYQNHPKIKNAFNNPIITKQPSSNKISMRNSEYVPVQKKNPNQNQQKFPIRSKSLNNLPKNSDFYVQQHKPQLIHQNIKHNQLSPISAQLQMLNRAYKIQQSKVSKKQIGKIKAYAANTHRGLIRNYNEDRVSIVTNMDKVPNKQIQDIISFFAVYDGHGGHITADFLKDNMHSILSKNQSYPYDLKNALKKAILQIQSLVLENSQRNLDFSGSCLLSAITINDKIYLGNVGDSRAFVSQYHGKRIIQLTRDHKPSQDYQKQRIYKAGGSVYQTKSNLDQINCPSRVFPGKLSVSRTIGDLQAKSSRYGGNNRVVVADPDIFQYKINQNTDFLFLASDGIFDRLTNQQIAQTIWKICASKKVYLDIHKLLGCCIEGVFIQAFRKMSTDNLTVLIVGFQNLKNIYTIKGQEKQRRQNWFESNQNNLNSYKRLQQVKEGLRRNSQRR